MKAADLYSLPEWYELLHAADTEAELAPLLELARRHRAPDGPWLEPACGGGRFLEALARRGLSATGYDRQDEAVRHAERRLAPFGGRARALVADMRGYRERGAYAVAFSLHGSLRHLMTERDAREHLRWTAASLKPGGLYLVGLDLCDYRAAADDEETWEARDGERSARQVTLCLAPEVRERREAILHFLELEDAGGRRLVEWSYELRSYDWAQWRALLASSPFELAGAYDQKGAPAPPAGTAGAYLFVLALRPAGIL